MRIRTFSFLLAIGLAGCSSTTSSSGPVPTHTAASGNVIPIPTATPGKRPTLKPAHGTPRPLPSVRTATPAAPVHFPASAFNATIFGTVTNVKTHRPLQGVSILVADGQRTVTTDRSGKYRISFPSRAAASVQARKTGFQCGLAMGTLKPGQSVRQDWQCQRTNPQHPVPPPFPSLIGTPVSGPRVPAPAPPGKP